jgi:hypothetical protein
MDRSVVSGESRLGGVAHWEPAFVEESHGVHDARTDSPGTVSGHERNTSG